MLLFLWFVEWEWKTTYESIILKLKAPLLPYRIVCVFFNTVLFMLALSWVEDGFIGVPSFFINIIETDLTFCAKFPSDHPLIAPKFSETGRVKLCTENETVPLSAELWYFKKGSDPLFDSWPSSDTVAVDRLRWGSSLPNESSTPIDSSSSLLVQWLFMSSLLFNCRAPFLQNPQSNSDSKIVWENENRIYDGKRMQWYDTKIVQFYYIFIFSSKHSYPSTACNYDNKQRDDIRFTKYKRMCMWILFRRILELSSEIRLFSTFFWLFYLFIFRFQKELISKSQWI